MSATIQPATNRTRVHQLASEGMSRQGGQTFETARNVGDRYLAAISTEAAGSLDGIVADVARKAAARRLYAESAYNAQNLALRALAGGVTGPIGHALASVGHDAMYKTVWHDASNAYSDGRNIGGSFLDAIADHAADVNEQRLARAARESVAGYLYNESAFKVSAEALKRIKSGVQGLDSVQTLAEFGRAARMKCLDNENARNVASPILEAIVSAGDPRAAAIAEVARKAAAARLRHDAASLAQDTGFACVVEPSRGSIEQDLADFGRRALNHCQYADDQRGLGHEILRGIARHAANPAARALAEVADQATCPHLYHASAAGVHYEAFALLAKATTTDPGRLLASFGLQVLQRGETVEDTRTMAQEVLSALAARETDPVRKGVLDGTVELAKSGPSAQVAIGIQRFAFNWMQKAPSLPATATQDATTDPAVLGQRITLNESIHKMLSEEIGRSAVDLADKQTQMHELAARFNPLVADDQALLKKARFVRVGVLGGGALALAGLVAANALPAGVGHAMLLGGGLVAFASSVIRTSINSKRNAVNQAYWPLRKRYDELDGEQQALQAVTAATRSIAGRLEEAVRKDRGALEVVKMSGSPKKEAGTIEVSADEVTIGGIRISRAKPKSAIGEDSDAPAVSATTG